MPKLNPQEAPEGYVAVRQIGCAKCAFYNNCADASTPCSGVVRDDKCCVIFKRKHTKPARNPREWLAWAFISEKYRSGDPIICPNRRIGRQWNKDKEGSGVFRVKITEVL